MGISQSRPFHSSERALFSFGNSRPSYGNYSGYNGYGRRNSPALFQIKFGGKKTRKQNRQSRKTRKCRK